MAITNTDTDDKYIGICVLTFKVMLMLQGHDIGQTYSHANSGLAGSTQSAKDLLTALMQYI